MTGLQVQIVLEEGREAPEAVIYAAQLDEEVRQAARTLRGDVLNGYRETQVTRLEGRDILRIYAEQQKVYAQTRDGVYQLRQRLYELEERLDPHLFLRISNSEIVRSDAILRLDMLRGGMIGMELRGGIQTYVSRRYVKKIRTYLGL